LLLKIGIQILKESSKLCKIYINSYTAMKIYYQDGSQLYLAIFSYLSLKLRVTSDSEIFIISTEVYYLHMCTCTYKQSEVKIMEPHTTE